MINLHGSNNYFRLQWKSVVNLLRQSVHSSARQLRFGFDHQTRLRNLAKEAGDVLCMINLFINGGVGDLYLTQEQLDNRIPIKRNKLKIYLVDILR